MCLSIIDNVVSVALFRCFCAVPFRGKMYVFGGESEKFNKKSKVRGKRELNRNAMW